MVARGGGLLLGYAADRVFADPQRWHPVAGFGRFSQAVEARWYADSGSRGAAHTGSLVGAVLAGGILAERLAPSPAARTLVTALATWVVLGGRTLEREATDVLACLNREDDGDLGPARQQVARLVGRDTEHLDESGISRAVIESVAENTSDAVVAPLVWGALAGVPGLLGYRAVNTLDAMVGHHSERYERYGGTAARLDDLVNLPGSRLSGLLTLIAVPRRASLAWRAWRRDSSAHPSPNAGVVEAAFAGALGIRLGGTNRYYGNRIEDRPIMGQGRAARPEDIDAATRIARRIGWLAAFGASGVCLGIGLGARRRSDSGLTG
ncbi:MAG: cobalamin biosynthesis protein [Actinomycetales bacterium]|nr:MAG: cobalamin biosynthesis protein [Actinomycetales bacterium]